MLYTLNPQNQRLPTTSEPDGRHGPSKHHARGASDNPGSGKHGQIGPGTASATSSGSRVLRHYSDGVRTDDRAEPCEQPDLLSLVIIRRILKSIHSPVATAYNQTWTSCPSMLPPYCDKLNPPIPSLSRVQHLHLRAISVFPTCLRIQHHVPKSKFLSHKNARRPLLVSTASPNRGL